MILCVHQDPESSFFVNLDTFNIISLQNQRKFILPTVQNSLQETLSDQFTSFIYLVALYIL